MELKKTEKRWIGIDGGGSKTSCVIGDEQGQILSFALGTSSNIHSISPQNVFHTLTQLINKVIEESKSTIHQIESIQLCLAGADRENDQKVITELFKDTLYEEKIKIRNDAEAALASGTWGQSGILLIAGTGSIVYVICNETNERMRVGGWGYLLGDEGSGFYIGQRALRAVLKAYDCRGQKTVLTNLVLDHFKVQQVPELLKLYSDENYVPEVARISQLVLEAAKKEDPVAIEILQDAVFELVQMVKVAYHHSAYKKLMLVLHGGLFSDAYFKNLFLKNLKPVIGDVEIAQPELPAVLGAYLLAIKESGLLIDDKFKKNINFSWNKLNHQ
ncbi:BadF/BadG/BcrA/BcrD ATPase family protein [Lysinibacillus telephonicus]|uniref:N-acetylglucosamine kinase n=1 Tax=Lysinibacillus telephonicus TaxID=1714840 RepID=UPI003978E555